MFDLAKLAPALYGHTRTCSGLLTHYGTAHVDVEDVSTSLQLVCDVIEPYAEQMHAIENVLKLIELQRDLVGLDANLVATNRVSEGARGVGRGRDLVGLDANLVATNRVSEGAREWGAIWWDSTPTWWQPIA